MELMKLIRIYSLFCLENRTKNVSENLRMDFSLNTLKNKEWTRP